MADARRASVGFAKGETFLAVLLATTRGALHGGTPFYLRRKVIRMLVCAFLPMHLARWRVGSFPSRSPKT